MNDIQWFATFFGRLFVGGFFVWLAVMMLRDRKAMLEWLKSKKVPWLNIVYPTAIALQLLGGALLILGMQMRLGALLLLAYNVPEMITLHDFWRHKGSDRHREMLYFMKDLAICGGLLFILALG